MVGSIRIRNLRSIKDSGNIKMRPVTILLGTNSSGKSTFLRSFPLFSQSFNKNLRGPVSWFDNNYVDFGDYKTAKNRYAATDEGIEFSYELANSKYLTRLSRYEVTYISDEELKCIHVSFSLQDESKGTYIKQFTISVPNTNILVQVNDRNEVEKILIDNDEVDGLEKLWVEYNEREALLPKLTIVRSGDEMVNTNRALANLFAKRISEYCSKRLKKENRLIPILYYGGFDKTGLLKRIHDDSGIKFLQKRTEGWSTKTPEFVAMHKLFVLVKINALIEVVNKELTAFYGKCDYVAPMRAEADRYYRVQGLQVQGVDATGHNMIEFISSLTKTEKEDYDAFVSKTLGVTVDVPNEMGMKSLKLKTPNGTFNISDVGYGYSQLLPVLTKLWHVSYKIKKATQIARTRGELIKSTILMEQPELHLHPAMQAKLADVFVNVVNRTREYDDCVNLVIETHSPTLINRLGRRVREGQGVTSDDINILLFEKDSENKNSIIKSISFGVNGQIKDWPYGFFDPED